MSDLIDLGLGSGSAGPAAPVSTATEEIPPGPTAAAGEPPAAAPVVASEEAPVRTEAAAGDQMRSRVTFLNQVLGGQIRHAMTYLGGLLAGAGAINQNQDTQFIALGTSLTLWAIAALWSIAEKWWREHHAGVA